MVILPEIVSGYPLPSGVRNRGKFIKVCCQKQAFSRENGAKFCVMGILHNLHSKISETCPKAEPLRNFRVLFIIKHDIVCLEAASGLQAEQEEM